jgi:hypothetical protein
VLSPRDRTGEAVWALLRAIRTTAEPEELTLLYVWAPIKCDQRGFQICLRQDESLSVSELAGQLARIGTRRLLVLDARWPEDGGAFPSAASAPTEDALLGVASRGLPLIAASLPHDEAQVDQWPFFSRLLQTASATRSADRNQNGVLELGEACCFAADQIRARNDEALHRISTGRPATVVPPPRLICAGGDEKIGLGKIADAS